jgi:hypothetical protein
VHPVSKSALIHRLTHFLGVASLILTSHAYFMRTVWEYMKCFQTTCENTDPMFLTILTIKLHVDFATTFVLKDLVSGISKSYENEYLVRVIGGGHSKTDITYFTDSEILAYNPSTIGLAKAPIWGVLHSQLDYTADTGTPILIASANTIRCECLSMPV